MGSRYHGISVVTSPKEGEGGGGGGGEVAAPENSPKGGMCVCSPTTHEGSFRCRHHRAGAAAGVGVGVGNSSTNYGIGGAPPPWMIKRSNSKSMPPSPPNKATTTTSLSPKSVEST